MRLAGTCNRYSNSAMPQLTSAAMTHGLDCRFLRCPYHANVMNRFDAVSINAVSANVDEVRFAMRAPHRQSAHFSASHRDIGQRGRAASCKRAVIRRVIAEDERELGVGGLVMASGVKQAAVKEKHVAGIELEPPLRFDQRLVRLDIGAQKQ